jgi:predicted O-linked N-acetylglucosamine transferase (SPINDLY family)
VLWLIECPAKACSNLRNDAANRCVDPDRLIFAKRLPLPEHLARHRHADLFLDTLPYNAHTTASDALWAGLPVLTLIGETFAGRVAASLLKAIGVPELIVNSGEDYVNSAVELATNTSEISEIRAKIERSRMTGPLFNTPLFTYHLESAFKTMYDRYQAGLAPARIAVPEKK